jgi:hypothetical protein
MVRPHQACTELLLEPITSDGYGFYPESTGQLSEVEQSCEATFDVRPRPFWMETAYGIGALVSSARLLVSSAIVSSAIVSSAIVRSAIVSTLVL